MELIIRNTDSQPIYEQIAAQLRRQILSGRWRRERRCPPSGGWPRT